MPTHWTYDECSSDSDLMQGDVLAPTKELRTLFKEVHPHFCDEKYLAFVIITQSCDLVRRKRTCSARYINVAVVRSLSAVLLRLLDTICEKLEEGIYSGAGRRRAHELLERIFNQNEQKLGLFYLYPDGDIGIGEDAVAFLRVSVAFRADHYDLMCAARQGRLRPEFANKLGWLVGNLYSRVGTRDWPPDCLRDMIDSHLSSSANDGPVWVDERHIRELKLKGKTTDALPRAQLVELAQKKARDLREAGIDRVIDHVRSAFPAADGAVVEGLRTKLLNDLVLANAFRR